MRKVKELNPEKSATPAFAGAGFFGIMRCYHNPVRCQSLCQPVRRPRRNCSHSDRS